MKSIYIILLTCRDSGDAVWSEVVNQTFATYDEAYAEMMRCAQQEVESGNEPCVGEEEKDEPVWTLEDDEECFDVAVYFYGELITGYAIKEIKEGE